MGDNKVDHAAPDYADYWRAALARHTARLAAGCISAVGALRVGRVKNDDGEHDSDEGSGRTR